jgi:hypothetical protein
VLVVPSGTETEPLAQIYLFDASTGQQVARFSGHSPAWETNDTLGFQANDGQFTYNVTTQRTTAHFTAPKRVNNPASLRTPHTAFAIYPQTIRVRHHPNNGCRTVPADQVDEIPFEEYVARVVPAEMPAFWQYDALAAQAVAARTYAWKQILAGRTKYDVSDWADFQMMCDDRYPISDAAVADTAGQYLSEIGDADFLPISAMYSAENGHPTLTNPNVTYLQAVPDLFALGQVRYGHGYGLSQWGAQRRALAGHSYRQILAHYYSNVHLQNALKPTQPLAGFRTPLPGDWWTTNTLRWQTLTTATASTVTVSITATHSLTTTTWLTGASGLWQTPLTLPTGSVLTATLWVDGERQEQVALPVDMTTPAAPTATISATADTTFSLTMQAENDVRIGLQEDWKWQGETLSHTVASGRVISDGLASNGVAWAAQAKIDQAGVWYGPYTTVLPAGRSYRALFWLRTTLPLTVGWEGPQLLTPIARLDVTDDQGNIILGLRDLWPSDLVTTTAYQPIAVDFHLFDPAKGVELRVAWAGQVDLALDGVEVWSLPTADWQQGRPLAWVWSGVTWPPQVAAAAFDQAGHVSRAVSQTVPLTDTTPPTLVITPTALGPDTILLTWQAHDDRAGVSQIELEVQQGDGTWQPNSQSPFKAARGNLRLSIPFTTIVPVRLRALDRAGQPSAWFTLALQTPPNWLYLPLISRFQ